MKKTATYKLQYSPQKGFSPIYILIAIVLVFGGVFLFTKNSQKSTNPTQQQIPTNKTGATQVTNEKFAKLENDQVVIYYPKSLKEGYSLPGFIEFRDNPNEKLNNHLTVSMVTEAGKLPYKAGLEEDVLTSNDECKQIVPPLIKYQKLTLVSSEYKEYQMYKGCYNIYSTDTNYNLVYYIVYQKPVADVKTAIFQVKGDYDTKNASMAEEMKEAVSYFTPK